MDRNEDFEIVDYTKEEHVYALKHTTEMFEDYCNEQTGMIISFDTISGGSSRADSGLKLCQDVLKSIALTYEDKSEGWDNNIINFTDKRFVVNCCRDDGFVERHTYEIIKLSNFTIEEI